MKEPLFRIGAPEYRSVGVLANPFRVVRWNEGMDDVANIACHVEAVRFMRALYVEADAKRPRPIWVSKSDGIPDFYSRISLGEILETIPSSKDFNVLVAYVPFFAMRRGRIRSALGMIAERLAGENFGLTLGRYAAAAFGEPDQELLEKAGIEPDEAAALAERFAAEPKETAAEFFGEDELSREASPSPDAVMRDAALRRWDLELDPEAGEEQSDTVAPLSPVDFTDAPVDAEPVEDGSDEDSESPAPSPVYTYLLSHARKHLSPVIARGLAKYASDGTYALSEELTLTKGPRKTLAAVARLATYQFRKVVLVYDQFNAWGSAPQDFRIKIAGSLAEIRMLLGANGIVAIMAGGQELEEVRDQFLGANEVEWAMPALFEEPDPDTQIQPSVFDYAFDAVSIDPELSMRLKAKVKEKGLGAGSELIDAYAQAVDDAASKVDL